MLQLDHGLWVILVDAVALLGLGSHAGALHRSGTPGVSRGASGVHGPQALVHLHRLEQFQLRCLLLLRSGAGLERHRTPGPLCRNTTSLGTDVSFGILREHCGELRVDSADQEDARLAETEANSPAETAALTQRPCVGGCRGSHVGDASFAADAFSCVGAVRLHVHHLRLVLVLSVGDFPLHLPRLPLQIRAFSLDRLAAAAGLCLPPGLRGSAHGN